MEEGLVGVVVELGRDGVEPHYSLSGVDVDETEPVVLLETCSLSDAQRSVGIDRNTIPAEDEHASEASEAP